MDLSRKTEGMEVFMGHLITLKSEFSGTENASGIESIGYGETYYEQIRRLMMNKQNMSKLRGYIRDYLVISFGSLLVAISVNLCLDPNHLAFGGVTGLSIIVEKLLGIPLNYTYYTLSFILLLVGGFRKGKDFFIKTLFAITVVSFVFVPCTKSLQEISLHIVIAAISGAALLGTGVGLILRVGGSTSGPDLIAALLKRRIPENVTMFSIDAVVFTCGVIVFGFTNFFSVIVLVATPFTVGIVLNPKKSISILARLNIWGRLRNTSDPIQNPSLKGEGMLVE